MKNFKRKFYEWKCHVKYKYYCLKEKMELHKYTILAVFLAIFCIFIQFKCNKEEFLPEPPVKENYGFEFKNLTKELKQSTRKRKKTDYVAIHHTAAEQYEDDITTIRNIENLHINKGYGTLCYHVIIIKNKAYYCHPLNSRIAGVENYNSSTINICIVGNFEKRQPTTEELETLKKVLIWVRKAYQKPKFCYHGDLNNTACCGKYLKQELDNFLSDLNKN